LTKFEAVLIQQNDDSDDNEQLQRELAKEQESNKREALERFKQEQLRFEVAGWTHLGSASIQGLCAVPPEVRRI
jgi:hypothetical protein